VLYKPEAFEPLTDEPWDERRVRTAIQRAVDGAEQAYDPDGLWPAHEWDAWQTPLPLKNFYVGAAGVIWALDALQRRGHAEVKLDLAAAAARTLELWRAEPGLIQEIELPSTPESSVLCGETGLLLAAWRLGPSAELADALLARIEDNTANEANELLWGSPGTMLVARAMFDWTGEERWLNAWRESADVLLARRDEDGIWTQQLYGSARRFLGPGHGLVANVRALLPEHDLREETAAVLAREAVVEDGLANWPALAGGELEAGDGMIRVQWCHGAPGIISTAAEYLDEELLLAGAELTWRAGAHGREKGPGICHGTAGNGYALLKTFARTDDERWLERARRFAVHALLQAEREGSRYSLFTGDMGAAVFASSCLDADSRFPVLDRWD